MSIFALRNLNWLCILTLIEINAVYASEPIKRQQEEGSFYPMVQTHVLDFRPLGLPVKHGYAFFIGSKSFNGKERVTVRTPEGFALPDLNTELRVLSNFQSHGMWGQNDEERSLSACNGALKKGTYTFDIESAGAKKISTQLEFTPKYIEPVSGIVIKDTESFAKVNWNRVKNANCYLVCVLAETYKDLLKDLIPVSTALHGNNYIEIEKRSLKPGRYRVAVRANHLWDSGTAFWAIDAESWAISLRKFDVLTEINNVDSE
jgi:hypothetical protein